MRYFVCSQIKILRNSYVKVWYLAPYVAINFNIINDCFKFWVISRQENYLNLKQITPTITISMIKTAVTRILVIKNPIIMWGMKGIGMVDLDTDVLDAVDIGIFSAHNSGSPEGYHKWIFPMWTLRSKPWCVNMIAYKY